MGLFARKRSGHTPRRTKRTNEFRKITLEELNLDTLGDAVIFFHARWSAPSVMALRELTEREDSGNDLPLYEIDIDTTTPEAIRAKFGFISHGWGETVRIRDGKMSVERVR